MHGWEITGIIYCSRPVARLASMWNARLDLHKYSKVYFLKFSSVHWTVRSVISLIYIVVQTKVFCWQQGTKTKEKRVHFFCNIFVFLSILWILRYPLYGLTSLWFAFFVLTRCPHLCKSQKQSLLFCAMMMSVLIVCCGCFFLCWGSCSAF